jgi:hypothetical protein
MKCIIVIIINIIPYLDCISDKTSDNIISTTCISTYSLNLKFTFISLFIGLCCISIGYLLCNILILDKIIENNGIDKSPKPLIQNTAGNWIVDNKSLLYETFLLFGDIELTYGQENVDNYSLCSINYLCNKQSQLDDDDDYNEEKEDNNNTNSSNTNSNKSNNNNTNKHLS